MTVAASAAGKRLLLTPLPIQSGSSANPSHPARQASAATGAAESAATSQQNRLAGARHGPRAIGALRKLRRPRVAKERPPAVHRSATSNIAVNASTGSARSSASAGAKSTPPSRANTAAARSEEHTSELQSLMRISYAVSCLKKKNNKREKETQP